MVVAQLMQRKVLSIVQKRSYNKWGNNLGADALARLKNKRTIEERKYDEEKKIYREKKRLIRDALEKQLLEELDKQEQAEREAKEKENKPEEFKE